MKIFVTEYISCQHVQFQIIYLLSLLANKIHVLKFLNNGCSNNKS